jgi:hypothetical protein
MKMCRQVMTCAAAALCALPLVAATPAAAQPGGRHEYAVKFFCGPNESTSLNPAAVEGIYSTAINVYNPGGGAVLFARLVALAGPGRSAGHTPVIGPVRLEPSDALDVDCLQIALDATRAGFTFGPFFTGFYVIRSLSELDVVAVYTAAPTRSGGVSTMATERVPVRRSGG